MKPDADPDIENVRRAKAGDESAFNALRRSHTPTLEYIARKYGGTSSDRLDVEDCFSWALVGLVKAVRSFDETQGALFSTHVANLARYEILHAERETAAMVRVPPHARPSATIRTRTIGVRVSVDDDGPADNPIDDAADPSADRILGAVADRLDLDRALASLCPISRRIVRLRAVDGESWRDIARDVNLSASVAQRRYREAVTRMRAVLENLK